MGGDPIQRLHDILMDQEKWHEPWTAGVVNISEPQSTLFFKCKNESRHIKAGSTHEADVKALVEACSPASFSRGAENVHDETYCKALNMGANDFAWLFNPDSGKFVAQLAKGLCPWDSLDRGIRLEPYKLNVYEKGGFFKAHKDIPRSEDMFGTLVFVLPFAHKGGNLALRHRGRKFTFDAPSLLKSSPPGSVAYLAFYSDVEHEVLEVTSGHRAAIIFSLHFDHTRASPIVAINPSKIPENPFTVALAEQLRNPSFIRSFRYLGFGLEYSYPKRADEYGCHLKHCLKGPDSFLFRILCDLGLRPSLKYLYRSEYGSCDFWVMRDSIVDGRHQEDSSADTELNYLLEDVERANIAWAKGKSEKSVLDPSRSAFLRHPWNKTYFDSVQYYRSRVIPVQWVTEPSDNLMGRTAWSEGGNEPPQEIYYYAVCIVVDISSVSRAPLV